MIAVAQVAPLLRSFGAAGPPMSLHARCLLAAQAKIQSLALTGLPPNHVLVRKVPVARKADGGLILPAVVLSPHRAAMPSGAGTNALDDVYYDVLVSIFAADNQEPTIALDLDQHLLWRQEIARAFRNQRLAGVSEIINTHVESAESTLEEAWEQNLLAATLLIRFVSREPRGD